MIRGFLFERYYLFAERRFAAFRAGRFAALRAAGRFAAFRAGRFAAFLAFFTGIIKKFMFFCSRCNFLI